jgi:hypothetical protein
MLIVMPHALDATNLEGAGGRLSATPAVPGRELLDDEGRVESHGPGHVVKVG